MDPIDFLVQHAPFGELSARGLERVAAALEIAYAERGEKLIVRGGAPSAHLFILRKGAVRLEHDGQLVDDLGAGEVFGFPSLLADASPQLDAVAERDCLLYRLPGATFRSLLESEPAFAAFFLDGLAARLRATLERNSTVLAGDLATPIGKLVARGPLFVDAQASVGEAARLMSRERVGSVLVTASTGESAGRAVGILTDRDLRCRVLAEGRGPETPIREVMSAPLRSCDANAPLSEALLLMLRGRIHHLPLEREGQMVGVVTHTDLLRHQVKSPGYLLKRIEKAEGSAALGGYADEMAGMVETLLWGGLPATDVGRMVATLNDALVSRLLGLIEIELGPPPTSYAFIVFGSEGRQEQALITDQDNALIYGEDTPEAAAYFEQLARRIVDELMAVGFPPCEGGFMATRWCHPLERWEALFHDWGQEPEPEALLKVANFFDFRKLHGGLDLASLEEAIRGAARSQVFLAQLTRASLRMRPPLGLFRRIRQKPEGVDLKAGAIMPIVGLARLYALEAGERAGSTLRRLRSASRAGVVSEEGAELLAEAFRFVFQLRLRLQLEALRTGRKAGNHAKLEALGALEKRHLKEAFLAVRDMQTAAAQRFGIDLLG